METQAALRTILLTMEKIWLILGTIKRGAAQSVRWHVPIMSGATSGLGGRMVLVGAI